MTIKHHDTKNRRIVALIDGKYIQISYDNDGVTTASYADHLNRFRSVTDRQYKLFAKCVEVHRQATV